MAEYNLFSLFWKIVDHDCRRPVDNNFLIFVLDSGRDSIPVVFEVLDDFTRGRQRDIDIYRPLEFEVLRKIDRQPRETSEGGTNHPRDECPVGNSTTKARLLGELVVEVQRVRVARRLGELANIVFGNSALHVSFGC